jgi:hypothetical protein
MIPDRPACERIRGSIRRHESDDLLRAPMTSSRSGPVALVALLLGLAFAAFYAGTSRGVFVFGDDILMYQVTEAIWERGEVAVASLAPSKDVAHASRGGGGRRFAKYGLGPSLVALPFYGASHWLFDRMELPATADSFGNLRTGPTIFGTGLANAATGGATVAVAFLLAVELGFPLLVALLTASCLGAGTLLAHYSSTFLSEPLSALCLAVAVLGLLKAKGKGSVKGVAAGRWWLAISGFAAGLAVATKVAHVVVVLPLFLWAAVLGWHRDRQRGLVAHSLYWSSCFLLWIGAIAAYNWSRFASVFETGYGNEAGDFTTPLAVGLSGLLVSPAKGVLWYCPVLVLAVGGALAFWRRDRACALAILAASAPWLLMISRYYQWYGGGSWGPRFLVPLLPLWILPAAEIFARTFGERRGSGWRVAILLLVAASLVASLAPLLVTFSDLDAPLSWSQTDFAQAGWRPGESPLLHSLEVLPEAVATTAAKLLGQRALGESGRPLSGPRFPDFAFEHYGSHALLEWTRGCFLVAALALALAVGLAKRASPPGGMQRIGLGSDGSDRTRLQLRGETR